MQRGNVGICVAIVLLLAGISGCNDPSEDLRQARQSIASWSASLDLADAQFAQRLIPSKYLGQLLQEAAKEIDRQRRQIKAAATSDPNAGDVAAATRELESVQNKIDELSERLSSGGRTR